MMGVEKYFLIFLLIAIVGSMLVFPFLVSRAGSGRLPSRRAGTRKPREGLKESSMPQNRKDDGADHCHIR